MRNRVWFPTTGLLVWLCCLSLGSVQAGKVVALPVDGSHWLSMKILVKELSRRGHEVTVLVPESSLLIKGSDSYKTKIYQVPYTQAELDSSFNTFREGVFEKHPGIMDLFANIERLVNFTSTQVAACEALLGNEPLMGQLKKEGFDTLLTDPFLPCGPVLAKILSIPAVYFLRGLPCDLDARANQCPSPPSYVPKLFSGNTDRMDFPQRVKNMLMFSLESYMCTVLYQHFDGLTGRLFDMTYKEVISHGAIWLLRHDFAFEWPKPLMPNMVLIGGINCAKKAPLPAVSLKINLYKRKYVCIPSGINETNLLYSSL